MKNHEIFWLCLMLLVILTGIIYCFYCWWLEYKYEKIGRDTYSMEVPAAIAKIITVLILFCVLCISFEYILTAFNSFLDSL